MTEWRELEELKKEYQNIPVPSEGRSGVETAVKLAVKIKRDRKRKRFLGRVLAAAAVLLLIFVLPNTSKTIAYAMQKIPVLGAVISVVVPEEYRYESERYQADVSVPRLVVEESTSTAGIEKSADEINREVDEMTKRLIQQFEADVKNGQSYGGVTVSHKVVTNTDQWFTLRIDVYEAAGSSNFYSYFYHINKVTGEIAQLKDIFKRGSDYRAVISNEIKKQMKKEMDADPDVIYWLNNSEIGDGNFKAIQENQKFYFDREGNIVICFDKYEVAPGYMGPSEFTIDSKVIAEYLVK
ncbi:Anti-sigma-V factor rsiV [uncultured Roseburia sp.]|uniref:RsiV family protein n=1 Tax=Brotonthovivens ammoniilytica TaxID=2981725 RepID=A0ABT2TFQ3_9FIRM|nr:RsiV family protein [Brotonthovivens ammoniilytica]MCU6761015.1 RsiV family protein [Brotonthovivens ammoniilytica]SCI16348.1 Anti-sigma-V factor rsiV [uncultured Roseburia sp.]